MSGELITIVNDSGLEKTKADFILEKFQDYFKLAAEWEKKARDIVVTSDEQKPEMEMARVGRLFLKEKRVTIEKTRKELKEQSLREGKAIDGIANVLKGLIEPIERYLDEQENFTRNRLIAEEKERLRLAEEMIVLEARAKEEARIKAEQEERERMRIENERLKLEAIERDKAAQIERQKLEKERVEREKAAQIEREKNEKILKEAREKAEAERQERLKLEAEMELKRKEAEAIAKEEKRKAAAARKAPDKDKIITFVSAVTGIDAPGVAEKSYQVALDNFVKSVSNAAKILLKTIESED